MPGFDRFVEAALHDYDVPGAVVVIVHGATSSRVKGFGVRERGKPAQVDAETRFQIASLSKFVTATAIGTFVDRGIVAWDTPVRTYSPETVLSVPYAAENATLRDYLSHRTGLPAYTGDLLAEFHLPAEELVRRARYLPFDHTFRAEMAYSNYGTFLGQEAVARAAGLSAPRLITTGILEPLAMARTGPEQATLFEDDNRAAGHDRDGAVMAYENVDAFSGAGAIVSTGADIATWMRMLLAEGLLGDRRILETNTLRQIFAPSIVEGPSGPLGDENSVAGLGCDSYTFMGHRIIEKNGALNGVRTIVTLVPDQHVGIAIFANKQLTVFPEAVRAEFLERQIGRVGIDLQARIKSEQAAWNALVDIPAPPRDRTPPAHDLDAYAGTYRNPFYGEMHVARGTSGLTATLSDQAAILEPWSADSFLLRFPNPDIAPGLLHFKFDGATATSIVGSRLPNTLTVNYGVFEKR